MIVGFVRIEIFGVFSTRSVYQLVYRVLPAHVTQGVSSITYHAVNHTQSHPLRDALRQECRKQYSATLDSQNNMHFMPLGPLHPAYKQMAYPPFTGFMTEEPCTHAPAG